MKAVVVLLSLLSLVLCQDCNTIVPPNPLTATGLSTPYLIMAGCNQSISTQASFVEGAVLDTNAGKMYVYSPLMINQGSTPLVAPVVPVLPINNVVGLWFGTNGGTLTLVDNGGSLAAGVCVNGLLVGTAVSIFGQVSYCNAVAFFAAANTAIANKLLVIPPNGIAVDGEFCPTVRDFFVVDQDQSDNVVTSYLVMGNQAAQDTTANEAAFPNAIMTTNASDNRLLAIAMDGALGCTPFKVPSLADPVNTNGLASQAANELSAAANQQQPQALVPLNHAMTRVNGQPDLAKVNAYRAGVNQPSAATNAGADSFQYCYLIYYTAPRRLQKNYNVLFNAGSADPNAATNLLAFLAMRFVTTFGADGLGCASLLNVPDPVVAIMNMGGQFTGATITVPNPPGNGMLSSTNLILVIVFSVFGGLLIIGLIGGVIWYRNRSMYS
jgi:hypothetical protein